GDDEAHWWRRRLERRCEWGRRRQCGRAGEEMEKWTSSHGSAPRERALPLQVGRNAACGCATRLHELRLHVEGGDVAWWRRTACRGHLAHAPLSVVKRVWPQ